MASILVLNNDSVDLSTNASIYNRLIYNSPLKPSRFQSANNAPGLTPSPIDALRPEMRQNMKQQPSPESTGQHNFFNPDNIIDNVADSAVKLGAGILSFFSHPMPTAPGNEHTQQSQPNPATFFSPQNKLAPTPSSHKQKDLEAENKKHYEEKEELRRRKRSKSGK